MYPPRYRAAVLILGIFLFGFFIGWLAQVILGRDGRPIDWTMAVIAGFAGSLVGGLLGSLLAGDGLALKPSGIIGSIVGALIITAVWQGYARRKREAERAAAKKAARSGRHH